MKKVVILFGEMGGGKNYWGNRLAKQMNCEFCDGDEVVLPDMAAKVANFKPLTREMVEDYVDILANSIADKMDHCDKLVVAQALYFNEDRLSIELFLSSLGYEVEFYWVRPSFWRNAKQLLSRPNGWKWVAYWLFNKPYFQKPTHSCGEIYGE